MELRHRGHARVEDSIRAGKDTGMRNLPYHAFKHNQTWLESSLISQDVLCWMRLLCLTGQLAKAEPKRLRHRLLHTAGRVVRHGRRIRLGLQADWPLGRRARRRLHAAAHDPRAALSHRRTAANANRRSARPARRRRRSRRTAERRATSGCLPRRVASTPSVSGRLRTEAP
jgi:hypothetical protein